MSDTLFVFLHFCRFKCMNTPQGVLKATSVKGVSLQNAKARWSERFDSNRRKNGNGNKMKKNKKKLPPGQLGLTWIGETLEFYKAHRRNQLFEEFVQLTGTNSIMEKQGNHHRYIGTVITSTLSRYKKHKHD
ncbi:hypothetical protein Scep_022134 [Stephania cephalantha]|uniref:Uncharacterized protein n=1 Tax=Stephania cephalantha TaxID=152367 RepID=A0AAP0F7D2_9MAGN